MNILVIACRYLSKTRSDLKVKLLQTNKNKAMERTGREREREKDGSWLVRRKFNLCIKQKKNVVIAGECEKPFFTQKLDQTERVEKLKLTCLQSKIDFCCCILSKTPFPFPYLSKSAKSNTTYQACNWKDVIKKTSEENRDKENLGSRALLMN